MSRICASLLAMLLLSLGVPAQAWADWVVARASGTVWVIAPDSTASAAVIGQALPNNWMLATASDGRAMLTRGVEYISISPDTQIVVSDSGPNTFVNQPTGTAEYEVEHTGVPHFTVQTPVLAAVVKGTHFTVTTNGASGSVSVERGVVEVTSNARGQRTTLTAGQAAALSSAGADLQVTGAGAATGPTGPITGVATAAAPTGPIGGTTIAVEVGDAGVGAGVVVTTGPGGTTVGADVGVTVGDTTAGVGAEATVGGGGVEVGAGAAVGSTEVEVGVGVGPGGVEVEIEVDVGPIEIDLGIGSSSESAPASGGGGGGLGGLLGGLL